jgi:chromosome segregation ATPase
MDKLAADVDDLCVKCSPADRDALREKFDRLQQDFDRVALQAGQRLDVCGQWTDYNDAHTTITDRIKALQKRLESKDLSSAEIDAISGELTELQSKLQELERRRGRLESAASEAGAVVKNSSNKQAVQPKSQLQQLQTALTRTRSLIDERRGKLDELGKLADKFAESRDSLKSTLSKIGNDVNRVRPAGTSADALRGAAKQLADLDQALQDTNLQRAELVDLAGRISSLDRSQETRVTNDVQSIEDQWNSAANSITAMQGHYSNVLSLWKHYTDTAALVKKEISTVETTVNNAEQPVSQLAAKKRLTQLQTAEQELLSHQRQTDQLTTRGQQLATELKLIPGANADVITNEVEPLLRSWNGLLKVRFTLFTATSC